MTEERLSALAERCRIEQPSRSLDRAIADAVTEMSASDRLSVMLREAKVANAPLYTSSVDAALALVPTGNFWIHVGENLSGKQPFSRFWQWFGRAVWIGRSHQPRWEFSGGPGQKNNWWQAHIDLGTKNDIVRYQGHSERGTPALALCIAALKALADTAHLEEAYANALSEEDRIREAEGVDEGPPSA